MGYYVRTTDCEIILKAENAKAALARVIEFNEKNDDMKRGGSYGPDGVKESWFSWMPSDFKQFKDIGEFFSTLGFQFVRDASGNYVVQEYHDKHGQEDLLMASLEHLVEHGSYAEWAGEDGEAWRWEFDNGHMYVREGYVAWREERIHPFVAWEKAKASLDAIKDVLRKVEG